MAESGRVIISIINSWETDSRWNVEYIINSLV
jgi:hypothetical protein